MECDAELDVAKRAIRRHVGRLIGALLDGHGEIHVSSARHLAQLIGDDFFPDAARFPHADAVGERFDRDRIAGARLAHADVEADHAPCCVPLPIHPAQTHHARDDVARIACARGILEELQVAIGKGGCLTRDEGQRAACKAHCDRKVNEPSHEPTFP